MFKVTAIYARVSSDKQAREGTIDSQLAAVESRKVVPVAL